MKTSLVITFFVNVNVMLGLGFSCARADELDFKKYSVPSSKVQFSTRLNKNGKFAKKYKSVLSEEIKKGPNFAQKFRVAQIGCGASCSMIAVIDCVSGDVLNPRVIVTDNQKTQALGDRLEVRLDSRLLILRGCLDEMEDRCGTHQLTLAGFKLKEIHFDRVK